mgnify:CR=1 FL=1
MNDMGCEPMRIIAGKWKGHPVKAVPSNKTRPTGDKIREAIFQMIGPYFEGGNCLDLFAGSGALGLEALSRGMEKAILVDIQKNAVETIHHNINRLHAEEITEVYRNDAFRALKALRKRELKFDLIFLDPPYHKVSYEKLLEAVVSSDIIKQDTYIVCEHDAENNLTFSTDDISMIRREIYNKTTAITIFKKESMNHV